MVRARGGMSERAQRKRAGERYVSPHTSNGEHKKESLIDQRLKNMDMKGGKASEEPQTVPHIEPQPVPQEQGRPNSYGGYKPRTDPHITETGEAVPRIKAALWVEQQRKQKAMERITHPYKYPSKKSREEYQALPKNVREHIMANMPSNVKTDAQKKAFIKLVEQSAQEEIHKLLKNEEETSKKPTHVHEPRHAATARREDQKRRVENRRVGSKQEERASRRAKYESEKHGTTIGDVLKSGSASAAAIKAKAKEILNKDDITGAGKKAEKFDRDLKRFAKQTGVDLKDLPREAIRELKNIDLTAAKKSAISSGKSIGKGIQDFGESEAKNLADSKNIDEEYITSGGLRSTIRGEKVRVDPDTREIEVKNASGMWIPTGRFAEVKIPGTIKSDGIEYTPSARSRVETYELLDNEPDVVSLPRQQEELFTYRQEENPFAGNPLGQLSAAEVAARITRQQRGGVSISHAFDSGIYTSQRKTYKSPTVPAYMTPSMFQKIRQNQSTEPRIEPRRGFAPVAGRNPLVEQNAELMRAIAADKARMQQVQPQQPRGNLLGDGIKTLFGNGGFYGIRQEPGRMKSLFSGNMAGIGATVGGLRQSTAQQQPQQNTSSESLFSGNLRNISATTSLFGGSNQRATESVLGVVGSGSFASVFPVHYGNKKNTADVSSPSVKPSGDKNMTAPAGTFELFRSTKQGIVKVALTPDEYRILSARNPAGYTGFYRVNGKQKPYKAYLSNADIQALQASGRLALVPKGPRGRK